MFAMELGKYQEIAKEIVMNAVKELSIEKGLKDLAEVWKMLEFTVVKHYKGKEGRGGTVGKKVTSGFSAPRPRGSRIHPGPDGRDESDLGGQHDERERDGRVPVHRPVPRHRAEVGVDHAHHLRGARIVAAIAEEVAVPRGYFRRRRHKDAAARGGEEVRRHRQIVQEDHERHLQEVERARMLHDQG